MTEIKIVFTGPTGAGKTTAIAALSETAPLCTEVANTDRSEADKDTTTVALDYGEITLPEGRKVKLFGTPGQERFSFLRRMLSRNALGIVVLLDNRRPDPFADLNLQLDSMGDLATSGRVVVGVGHTETHPQPDVGQYANVLARALVRAPVVSVDVRRREHVVLLLELLLSQIEAYEDEDIE